MSSLTEQISQHGEDAAWLRHIQADVRPFVEAFAVRMEASMPGSVKVDRRRKALFGPLRVVEIRIFAGDYAYTVTVENERLICRRGHVSGGIILQRETMPIRPWMESLLKDFKTAADETGSAHDSLETFLLS